MARRSSRACYFVAINWHLAPSEMSYILADSNAKAVFTERRFAEVVGRAAGEANSTDPRILVADGSEGFRSLSEFVQGQSERSSIRPIGGPNHVLHVRDDRAAQRSS